MKQSGNIIIFATIFITTLVNAIWFSQNNAEPLVVTEIVEIPIELREFSGEAHLEHWLTHRDDTIRLVSGADFNSYDCDDYARQLVSQARRDGYDVWVDLVGEHMICGTIMGNDYYRIEPQTGEHWKETELD